MIPIRNVEGGSDTSKVKMIPMEDADSDTLFCSLLLWFRWLKDVCCGPDGVDVVVPMVLMLTSR